MKIEDGEKQIGKGYQEEWSTKQTLYNTVLTSETTPVKLALSVNWGWALYAMKHNAENALAAATCISLKNIWGPLVSQLLNALIRYKNHW